MSVSEPVKIITPWAESGLKNPIPPTANPATGRAGFDQGFSAINMTAKEAGGIPPFGQDFNGIFYEVTNILRYMQAGGQPTFDAALATAIGGYPKGAMVLGSDGTSVYKNIVDSNSSNPNSGGSGWAREDLISREALRRSYEEAGYNLVDGSFEAGGTLVNANDVLLQESTGAAYSWSGVIPIDGKIIPAGSTPLTTGGIGVDAWVDRTDDTLRSDLTKGVIFVRNNLYSLRDIISVKDFGIKCDGSDETSKLLEAIEYMKNNGGGSLYFPGFVSVTTIELYGSIIGGLSTAAPSAPVIKFISNLNGGIKALNSTGTVIQFGSELNGDLSWMPFFDSFIIDCDQKNVVAINGSAVGSNSKNYYIGGENLWIMGLSGDSASGIIGGNITDSTITNLKVQGGSLGCINGIKIRRAAITLVSPQISYCKNAITLYGLPEAQVTVLGGRLLVCEHDLYYEYNGTYQNQSTFNGVFLGEKTNNTRYIVGRLDPNIDIGCLNFIGCHFDTMRADYLLNFDFGGRIAIIGCYCLHIGLNGEIYNNKVSFGQYVTATFINNTGLAIEPNCQAVVHNQINNFLNENSTSIAGGLPISTKSKYLITKEGSPFSYEFVANVTGDLDYGMHIKDYAGNALVQLWPKESLISDLFGTSMRLLINYNGEITTRQVRVEPTTGYLKVVV